MFAKNKPITLKFKLLRQANWIFFVTKNYQIFLKLTLISVNYVATPLLFFILLANDSRLFFERITGSFCF